MCVLERKYKDKNVFFIVKDDISNKVKDFFYFGKNDIPNIEKLIFNIMDKTLKNEFENNHYKPNAYQTLLNKMYGIDFNGKQIEYQTCFAFRKTYLHFKNLYENELIYLRNKITFKGIENMKNKIISKDFYSLTPNDEEIFNSFFSFFPFNANKENIFKEFLIMLVKSDEEQALKKHVDFETKKTLSSYSQI